MTITEYANILKLEIHVRYYPSQNHRWVASFHHAEVKAYNSHILKSEYGDGFTPQNAINNYINAIEGKTLVINAGDESKRREYEVPFGLVIDD